MIKSLADRLRVADVPGGERTVTSLYLPVAEWLTTLPARQTLLVGLNGPQGSGKSSLTGHLTEALQDLGVPSVAVSIDDFYLTRSEQQQLADRYPESPYLQQRGYPGTHDIDLGVKTLQALLAGELPVSIPRYDKAACKGLGDRSREVTIARERPRLIFLEGWMLGFEPQSAVQEPAMRPINARLADYRAWTDLLHAFVCLKPQNVEDVLAWRVEAEANMVARGNGGMSPEQVRAYIELFLPAYRLYGADVGANLDVPLWTAVIGRDRLPVT